MDETPPILDYASGIRPPRRRAEAIAWVVIAAAVTIIVAGHVMPKAAQRQAATATAGIEQTILGRYAVGMKTLLSRSGLNAATTTADLEKSILDAARTPTQKLRAVPVLGELSGQDAALKQLDSIEEVEGASPPPDVEADIALMRTIYTAGPEALSDEQRQTLVDRRGWFGQLALGYGQPSDNSVRSRAIGQAVRAALAGVGMLILVLLGLVAGLVLLIVAIVLAIQGTLVRRYVPRVVRSSAFLEAFAIYLAAMALLPLIVSLLPLGRGSSRLISWMLIVFLPIIILWPRLRGVSGSELREGFGWHAGKGLWREIGAGLGGYVAGLPLVAMAIVLTMILSRFTHAQPTHPIIFEAKGGGWQVLMLYLLAAVWAPVVEETMFRGALYHHLRQRWGWMVSAVFVAVLFAAIHPQGWTAIPPLAALAFIFATIREWRGSLIGPVVAHALNNAVLVTLLVLLLG